MSALPNPLQELAEKLALDITALFFPSDKVLENAGEVYELLTASVGTLLQAERAATIENTVQRIEGAEKKGEYSGLIIGLRELALADASALAAVVQRETAQLRELLKRCLDIENTSLDEIYQLDKDIAAALQ